MEGAHIDPYIEPASDNVQNGLLLRRDVHSLFDAHLIGIEPRTHIIHLAPEVEIDPDYATLRDRKMVSPRDGALSPDEGALERHWAKFRHKTVKKP